jgi:ice-binding like protein
MKFPAFCLLVFLALALALNANAQTPNLATAGSFAVLAGTGVTGGSFSNTIRGNVGSYPTPAITGFTATTVNGTLYTAADPVVLQAKKDLSAAYGTAAGDPCPATNALTGRDLGTVGNLTGLGGLNVYCFTSGADLTGTLTLHGGPSDVFVFQIASTLTAETFSTVALAGVSPCNVFWQVGSSATLKNGTTFVGTIMALTNITLGSGILNGRALARNAQVNFSGQETIINGCSASSSGSSIVLSPVNSSIICGSGATITKTAVVLSNGVPLANATVTFTITGPDSGKSGTGTTDASGITTFTFAPTGADTVVAKIGTTVVSNTTFATCSGPISNDFCSKVSNPTVSVVNVVTGPPKVVVFSVQAPGGLVSLVVNTPPTTNATVVIPSFSSGTTDALGVTATKINQSLSAVVELTVTDLCGHITVFDPVFATITIPEFRSHHAAKFNFDHWEVTSFDGIGRTEGIVLLQNDTPGVESLVITVNGSRFRTQLSDGETKKINISSALFHGHNTVRVAAYGDTGSSVDLAISDGK